MSESSSVIKPIIDYGDKSRMVIIKLTAKDCETIRIALACLSNPNENLEVKVVREVANNATADDMIRLHNLVYCGEMGWDE